MGLYRLLICSSSNPNSHTQLQWEHDLGFSLNSIEWERIWRVPAAISKSVRFRVIQMKIHHRVYITPARMKKIDPLLAWVRPNRDSDRVGIRDCGTVLQLYPSGRMWSTYGNVYSILVLSFCWDTGLHNSGLREIGK